MGEGGTSTAAAATTTTTTASATTIHNNRKAIGSNASRAATPTNTADAGISGKRPRSEIPSDSNAAAGGAGIDDETLNNGNTISGSGGGGMVVKKKKKTNNSIGNSGEPSSSNSMTFEEEIAYASSQVTARLLDSSLHRLTDGIPRRELKLVISEARACEAALENELRILKEGLELEQRRNQNERKNDSCKVAQKNESGKPASEKKTADLPPASDDGKKKGAKDDSSSTTTTGAFTTPTPKETAALVTMLESEFSPPDTHWTLSALLGRLRHELTTPLPPRSQLPGHRETQGLTQLAQNVGMTSQTTYKKRGPKPQMQAAITPAAATVNQASGGGAAVAFATNTANSGGRNNETTPSTAATGGSSVPPKKFPDEGSATSTIATPMSSPPSHSMPAETSQFKRLASLPDYPEYIRDHATPDKLLAVWKKLSTHRSSLVFRRPVNPKEAPGYTERIRFPMDLSLIRKLVLSKHIKTYEGVLKQVHLIGHNCVKYNGRESDYALVTREFESVATEYIWNAVMREIYGSSRGRWSRNASPMPPSSSAMASLPASASPAAAKSTTAAALVASTGSAVGGRTPAIVTQTTSSSASGSSAKS